MYARTTNIKIPWILIWAVVFCFTVQNVTPQLGGLITRPVILDRTDVPYFVRNDVIIAHSGELILKPGVKLHFSPTFGITVFGKLYAEVRKL